jgi:hypothetical protein
MKQFLRQHHGVKTCAGEGGLEGMVVCVCFGLHGLLASVLDGRDLSSVHSGHFVPMKATLSNVSRMGWAD